MNIKFDYLFRDFRILVGRIIPGNPVHRMHVYQMQPHELNSEGIEAKAKFKLPKCIKFILHFSMLPAVGGSGISETVISFKIMKRIILLNQINNKKLIHKICKLL